jgi:hypothetical protein
MKQDSIEIRMIQPCIQPTFTSVDQEILKAALNSIEIGLEHLRGALMEHEALHPSPTLKAKVWGKRIQTDIANLMRSEVDLRKCLGWPAK